MTMKSFLNSLLFKCVVVQHGVLQVPWWQGHHVHRGVVQHGVLQVPWWQGHHVHRGVVQHGILQVPWWQGHLLVHRGVVAEGAFALAFSQFPLKEEGKGEGINHSVYVAAFWTQ